MKNMKAMMLSVSVLFFSSFALAATVYVATPENGGSDAAGDGSAGAPYATVTKGLEELVKTDPAGTLSIGEGTFYGPHNTWAMGGKAAFKIESGITVVGAGPEKTILTLEPLATQGRVLYINHAGARVSGLTVTGGRGFEERWKYGSGVIIDSAGGILSNAVVRGNNFAYVCQNGGAVEVNGANSMITHCVITNNGYSTPNSVGSYAGGVHVLSGTVANCLIADNRSIQGAGIFPDGAAKIYNCTITRNHAVRNSESVGLNGGIRIFFPGFTVVNTIFCDNRADNATGTSGGEEFEMPASPSSYVNGFVNCAFGNTTGVQPFGVNARAIGTDCFTDPAAGDYTLAPGASAIEGGTMYDAIAAKDLAGNDRVMGTAPDIGCYEYDPTKFRCGISVSSVGVFSGGEVTFTASVYGTNDEEVISYEWTVRDATGNVIAESTEQSFTAVLEAAGGVSVSLTVTGDGGRSVSSERENAVVVTPREMFAVAGENPNARPPYEDWAHAATNLNDLLAYAVAGQTIYLGEGTFYGPERAVDGAFVVDKAIAVVGEGPEKTILTLDPTATQGRVLCIANAAAHVSGITVTGGMGINERYKYYGSAAIIDGGGTLSNAVIRGNNIPFTQQNGGAIHVKGAAALLTHCVVTNNGYSTPSSSGAYAGGVVVEDGVVDNCLIADNRSIKGAGVYVRGSARIRNCTIAHNHSVRNSESTGLAGGIYNNGLTFKVMNTLFCDNRADSATGTIGGEEFELPSTAADATAFQNAFSHCAFGNSTGVQPIGGEAKAVTTDCFTDPSSGDYTLVRGTAAIEGGDYYEGLPETDLAGNPRVIGDWPDIGSYEFDTTQFGCGIDVSAVSVFEGETVTFAAVVYGAQEGEEIAYAWALKNGDGATLYESTAATFDYAPDCAGLITASLTVMGEGGRTATETKVGVVSVRSHDIYVVAGENADSREPYEDWAHAATNLVDALAYAVGGQTVHVGEGTFFGPNNLSDGAFVVNKAITVVGAGPEKTILTLDPAATHGRVLCIANAGAFVSGLTVTGGRGYEERYVAYGGAIILDNGGTLSNAVVRGNFLAYVCQYGGAVEVKGAGSLMTHCIVTNNGYSSASPSGAYAGGVHVTDGTLRNCFVSDNHGIRGGGIGVAGSAKVYNCTVVSNSSDDASLGVCGGIFTAGSAFKTVNSIFAGNHAVHPGGGDGNEEWEVSAGVTDPAAFALCFSNCGFAAAAAVGEGSLAVADLDAVGFRNIEGGDFALDNHSPFYKKGVYQTWMDGAKDLAGNDRVVKFRKGTWLVDMGAYESPWVGPGFMLLLR